MSPTSVIEKLEHLRKKEGLTQEELALKINTTRQNYARIVKNPESITFKKLTQIAEALNVDLKTILFEGDLIANLKEKQRKLESELETLKLQQEIAQLKAEKSKSIFIFYFQELIKNLIVHLTRKISEGNITNDMNEILLSNQNDNDKISNLLLLVYDMHLTSPQYFSREEMKEIVDDYIKTQRFRIEKNEKGTFSLYNGTKSSISIIKND